MGGAEKPASAAGGKCRALALAAFARIASEGFEGLRTRDVAADVGVNIGTLHYYFPSKEALIRAAADQMLAKFFATLSPKGSPAEQLRSHLDNLCRLMKSDPELWAVASEVTLRTVRDADVAGVVQHANDQWYAFLRDLVAGGVAEGDLAAGLDPDRVAATLIAAVQGASLPTMGTFRPERLDLVFEQLERWLGLPPAPAAEPNQDEGEPRDDGEPIDRRPDGRAGIQQPKPDVDAGHAADRAAGLAPGPEPERP